MSPTTISTRSVRPVIEHLRRLGLDPADVVAAAGSRLELFEDPDGRIPHQVAIAVWIEAIRASRDDVFGIHTAEQIRPGAFDALDYATRCSATLGEGLERLARYHRLLHDGAVVRLDPNGDGVRMTHELPGGTALPPQVAEFIVAAWVVVARQATGVEFAPVRVLFRHAEPADPGEQRRFFRAPLVFGATHNGIELSRRLLELPLVRADPSLLGVLERHVDELLARLPRTSSVRERVQQLVANDLCANPDAASIAEALQMSRRTLQRQLAADGTTFRGLVDGLRRDLALRYLSDRRLAVSEIAFLLGFSELSAFHRAFRRWTGTTPAAFRASDSGRPIG